MQLKVPSLAAAAIIAMLLTGCASSPPRKHFSEIQLGQNAFQVSLDDAIGLSQVEVSDFVMLQSAVTTLKHGFTHFVVVDSKSYQAYSSSHVPAISTTNASATKIGSTVYGTGTTTTVGGYSITRATPSGSNTILCFTEPPRDSGIVYDAKLVGKSLQKKYGYEGGKK